MSDTLWFRRFDRRGAPIAPKQQLDLGMQVQRTFPLVTYRDGYAFVVRGPTTEAVLVRMTASGSISQAVPFTVPATTDLVYLISIENENVLAWVANANEVWTTTVRADGTVDTPRQLFAISTAASMDIGMTWTRDRIAIVTARDDTNAIRFAIDYFDPQGNPLDTRVEVDSYPWSTIGEHRRPTVLSVPGRVAFAVSYRAEPIDSSQQSVYQRCY